MKMKVYLGRKGSVPFRRFGFLNPMYKEASEIMMILKATVEEDTGARVETVMACRCGLMEEHLVIQTSILQSTLLLQMWPVFLSSDRRVEYKLYSENERISGLIRYYLAIFARANGADLIARN